MFEFRQILLRMRLGDSDRALAKAGLIGRPKAKALRALATGRIWLDPASPLPDDAVLARTIGGPRAEVSAQSRVEPYRDIMIGRAEQGIQSRTIYQALVHNHAFRGS